MIKILIGILTYDHRIDSDLTKTLLFIERQQKYHLDYVFPMSSHLSRNRNHCVKQMLEWDNDWLLFLDSDISIKNEFFIDKLLEAAYKFDAKIIGGTYRMKKPNEYILIVGIKKGDKYDNIRKKLDKPQLVDSVGTGIMLIKREVFEKVVDPWFTIIDKPNLDVMPEDFEFCRKAQLEGFKIALVPLETNHWGLSAWTT